MSNRYDDDKPTLKVPDDLDLTELPQDVLQDLRSLEKKNSEQVGKYLLMSSYLLDDDPEKALEYALAAKDKAGRIAVVRESVGIAAYYNQDWHLALSELRAAKRISGNLNTMPLIADSLRAMGEPMKAVEQETEINSKKMSVVDYIEFEIVMASAWMDMHKPEIAANILKKLIDKFTKLDNQEKARLYFVYANSLAKSGKTTDSQLWLDKAVQLDSSLDGVAFS